MLIGVDFDNTIVCYDDVFGKVAIEQGLVPPSAASSKASVRAHLRSIGQEDRWTELQGYVYGPGMIDAAPFPGVVKFFERCREIGIPLAIISHRTRFPYVGEAHDLHQAACDWLERYGFYDSLRAGLPVDRVFFEDTKEAKLKRIATVGCTHFLDDLPELLSLQGFPSHVQRFLFDPHSLHKPMPAIDIVTSWSGMETLLDEVWTKQ